MSFRLAKLANEHRQFYATLDQDWEGPPIRVRGRRSPTTFKNAQVWDNYYVSAMRSWKKHRKTQYKPW